MAEGEDLMAGELTEFGNEFMALLVRRQKALAAVCELTAFSDGLSVVASMMTVLADIMWLITTEQFQPSVTHEMRRQIYINMWSKVAMGAVDRASTPKLGESTH